MSNELPRSINFELFVLLVIVLLRSPIIVADTYVSMANATASKPIIPPSLIPVTSNKQTDDKKLPPSANELVGAVGNLGEASEQQVEEKRDNHVASGFRASPRHLRNTCVPRDDIETEKGVQNDDTSRLSADDKNVEYDRDEEEDDDENQNDEDVMDDGEVRQNLKRKAGRRSRQGPKIWDQWGKWTSCSVSCGAGKLTRWRHCVAGGCSLGNRRSLNPKVWDQWGGWSSCSATCGTGKNTRWRHCVAGSCASGEKEAQIKSCNINHCS